MTGTTTAKRVEIWLNSPPIGLALERIHQSFLEGFAKNSYFIRFEDLTRHPQEVMDGLYRYLNLEGYKHDFENVQNYGIEDDLVFGLSKNLHKTRPKVEPVIDDSVEVLGEEVCRIIDNHPSLQWYHNTFNYK